ncbi:methylated-DNA--[protein]-cysteine S-methyltransferase [Camelimonas abortus]|uniref:Methylated-DNA--protein-cysteine methyltransferase n=1 Tax=Camelimonas abortus TaxID=1017184 RepID=A0ABV7LEY4_9HYPH
MTGNPSRQPARLVLSRFPAPAGVILLASDENGVLRALDWEGYEARMQRLLRRHYPALRPAEGQAPAAIADALDAYFSGELAALDAVPVATSGTPFQQRVWAALRQIPPGETRSYAELATMAGATPRAVRAVGQANGANPIGVVVPCHRVIASDGSLGGYAAGLARKRWLLTHEGAAFRDHDAPVALPLFAMATAAGVPAPA